MTPSQLKALVIANSHEPYFFNRGTMKFFGDTMTNYGVRSATINTRTEQNKRCWELYRKRPVRHGLIDSTYFCANSFERCFPTNN